MEYIVEVVMEVLDELFSEGIDAAITVWRERKKEENRDVSEELNH